MDTMEVAKIDTEMLFYDIKIKAIKKLEKDFQKKGIDTTDVNTLMIQILSIENLTKNEDKIKMATLFLINNAKYYIIDKNTPLNNFFRNCNLIIKKHL